MAPTWRWLLMTLAVLAVSSLVPGSMLSQPQPQLQAGSPAIPTGALTTPSRGGCAAMICNRGTSSSSAPIAGSTVAGAIAGGVIAVVPLFRRRRMRNAPTPLPTGSSFPLLRPPQMRRSASPLAAGR